MLITLTKTKLSSNKQLKVLTLSLLQNACLCNNLSANKNTVKARAKKSLPFLDFTGCVHVVVLVTVQNTLGVSCFRVTGENLASAIVGSIVFLLSLLDLGQRGHFWNCFCCNKEEIKLE